MMKAPQVIGSKWQGGAYAHNYVREIIGLMNELVDQFDQPKWNSRLSEQWHSGSIEAATGIAIVKPSRPTASWLEPKLFQP
ncbi:MAG: hypothetical protein U0930_22885 [Pirellulales bacterium]